MTMEVEAGVAGVEGSSGVAGAETTGKVQRQQGCAAAVGGWRWQRWAEEEGGLERAITTVIRLGSRMFASRLRLQAADGATTTAARQGRGSAGAVGGYDSRLEGAIIVEQGRRQRRQWHRRKERPTMRKKRKKMRAAVGVRREFAVNAEREQDFTDPGRLLQSLRSDRSTRKGGNRDGSGRGAAMLLVRVEKKAAATAAAAAWAVGGDERQMGWKSREGSKVRGRKSGGRR
ncbi:hypothetical protein GW17_00003242 [Ensete ventricosum]|nr:hypothetical protein GW17_00003242 [Ensete ventricosum]